VKNKQRKKVFLYILFLGHPEDTLTFLVVMFSCFGCGVLLLTVNDNKESDARQVFRGYSKQILASYCILLTLLLLLVLVLPPVIVSETNGLLLFLFIIILLL
jgi:cell division protein FtsW (lipid II flippase)